MRKYHVKALCLTMCLVLAVSLLVGGCAQSAGTPDKNDSTVPEVSVASTQGVTPENTPAVTKEPVTITYWCHSSETFVKANEQFIDAYTKENPNVTVKLEVFPANDFMQKLKAAFAAKSTGDVIQMFGSEAIPYVRNGLLNAVSDSLQTSIKENFFDVAIGAFRGDDGKIYGIPREINLENGGVLYFPADLKTAGYSEFPKTYEELIDAAKKMTEVDSDGNIRNVGFDHMTTWNNTFLFYSYILQQGGDYWQDDAVHVDYTSNEAEAAMQAIVDLFTVHKVSDLKHLSVDDTWANFFKGNSSMCFVGPWAISEGLQTFDNHDFSYGLMPSFKGDSHAFAAETGWGEVVSVYSANTEVAWNFVDFITSDKNALDFNIMTSTIPSRKSILEAKEYVDSNPMLAPSLKVLPEGRYIGPLQNVWTAMEIIEKNTKSTINNEIDVKTALQKAEEETNAMIDEQLAQ